MSWDPSVGRARGVLLLPPTSGKFKHLRRAPATDLACWIDHYWIVSWDLRGSEPYPIETLPHPNVQLVIEESGSRISGVHTRKFSRGLAGASQVFGVKFRAGTFRPFLGYAVSKLANRTIPATQVFGNELHRLEEEALSASSAESKIDLANKFFLDGVPQLDPDANLAGKLVSMILDNARIRTVDDLSASAGMTKRMLQRIFREYVGATPKWVIRRSRLHELVEMANSGKSLDWAQVALDLGYFDQAHLINDFRSIVGYTPGRYRSRIKGR
ncbi:MAG TPA: helix-turn-helix domain-containing protein [Terriglobales bacterium]|nr:helix-turn-helix domain-containing protein [Terriglobales bacterium]